MPKLNAPQSVVLSPEIHREFLTEYTEGRSRQLTVALKVALLGMAAGFSLDASYYPNELGLFTLIRGTVVLVLCLTLLVLKIPSVRLRPKLVAFIGIFMNVLMNASFCLMMYLTDGVGSPYYAGMLLVFICMAGLLMWSAVECAVMCLISVVLYVVAMLGNHVAETEWKQFAFNVCFLLVTTGICIAVSYFMSGYRRQDFYLRHQLDLKNRQLQDLDRLKTDFFSNVSHELRTPLTLILGPADLVLSEEPGLSPSGRRRIEVVKRNALRLLKLVNDLLELMRLEQGKDSINVTRFPSAPFLRGLLEIVRPLADEKQQTLVMDLSDTDMTADATRLEKVVLNLLTNGVKYTPAGGTITLRSEKVDNSVRLIVKDTGIGIPDDEQGKIFDRFHQVREHVSNRYQGVGIGLALVRDLVEEHGGSIRVESSPGMGAAFIVTLPFRENAPRVPEPLAESEPVMDAFRLADRTITAHGSGIAAADRIVGTGERTILVADDEPDMREFIVSVLSEKYRVIQTADGGDVLELVEHERPDLVLLDWMMPKADGLSLCKVIKSRSQTAETKVVLLTARNDEESKVAALELGADDYLTKPFSALELRGRIHNHLESVMLQRDLKANNARLQDIVEKLNQTRALLVQSEKMTAVGALSAGLLHEVNNPLNYTLTAIEFALGHEAMTPEDTREVLLDVREGLDRIRAVITSLRSFAYPESSDKPQEYLVTAPLDDAKRLLAKDLDSITLRVDVPAGLTLVCLKQQLMLVFVNLISNAVKAFPAQQRKEDRLVTVSAAPLDEGVEIVVADTGAGMSPEIKRRAFEPFFTTKLGGGGLGMGLSICQGVLHGMNASIHIEDNIPRGTRFVIRIPNGSDNSRSEATP